jgi:hypothetical protein
VPDRDGRCGQASAQERADPAIFNSPHAGAGDILLLLSDGAWTPLSLYVLQKTVTGALIRHFSDCPPRSLTQLAGQAGRTT